MNFAVARDVCPAGAQSERDDFAVGCVADPANLVCLADRLQYQRGTTALTMRTDEVGWLLMPVCARPYGAFCGPPGRHGSMIFMQHGGVSLPGLRVLVPIVKRDTSQRSSCRYSKSRAQIPEDVCTPPTASQDF